jgi:tetratricopeptide (TPR) repeat protein
MKNIIILIVLAVFAVACGSAPEQTAGPPQPANANVPVQKNDDSLTVSSHSQNPPGKTEAPAAPDSSQSGTKSKWTQSGEPIDTSAFDAKITAAEKSVKAGPTDEAAKKALAEAFLDRAMALTNARQYASALGDYRRALKNDPGNEEAKKWIGQIIDIYDSLNKSYPPEGEEPPPLEFKKGS